MKKISILLFTLFFSLVISGQSPWLLDKKEINIVIGNVGEYSGANSSYVQVFNLDTVSRNLVWEVDNPYEDLGIEMFDQGLHYLDHVTTNCLDQLLFNMNVNAESEVPVGVYNLRINDVSEFDFPAKVPVYLAEYPNCNERLDTFFINITEAEIVDYKIEFEKEEITYNLNEPTGTFIEPKENLRILNNSDFNINIKWRINDETLPEGLKFTVESKDYNYNYEPGRLDNCDLDDMFIIGGNPNSIFNHFIIERINTLSIDNWDGFPYQFTIDLMLPGCDTILDSIIVNLVNGTTAINDNDELRDIVLFPNPVSQKLFVKSNVDISKIKIIDIAGRVIIETRDEDIDVSRLNPGLYFAIIYSASGQSTKKMFVVSKKD